MSPEDFRRLVAAGLDTEQIALVMEMMDAQAKVFAEAEEARKAKGRERVAKWRESRSVTQRNVTETSPKVTEPLVRDHVTRVDDKQKPIDTSPSQNTTAKDRAEFCEALASLDADRLNGLLKVRKAKKAPATGHAAQILIKAAATCGLTLAEAADLCIERNWLTVKPDWIAPRQRGSPNSSEPNQPTLANVFADLSTEAEYRNDPRHRPSDQGPGSVVSYLPRVQTR